MSYDVFLSYASTDRAAIVEPLLRKLQEQGVHSWCDVHEIRWGDSIVERIQEGLGETRFVIAFISKAYLERRWTMKELRTAMAQQVSGRTTVLPVLMGVSPEELGDSLPFLYEVRHEAIYGYDAKKPVDDSHLNRLVGELERVLQTRMKKVKVSESSHLLTLDDEILSVSYNRGYSFYAIISRREYAEVLSRHSREDQPRSNILESMRQFIEKQGLLEHPTLELCYLDIGESPSAVFVLPSGNLITPHRGAITIYDYVVTGAPAGPCVVTVVSRNETVILGYPNGSIVAWNRGTSHQLGGHSCRVTALDTSTESILVSGDEAGNVAIWSRRDWSLRKMLHRPGVPVTSIGVSRDSATALIATGYLDGKIEIHTFDGMLEAELSLEAGPVTHLKFLPGAAPLLVSAFGSAVETWDYAEGGAVARFDGGGSTVTALHVSGTPNFTFLGTRESKTSVKIALVVAGFSDGRVLKWTLEV